MPRIKRQNDKNIIPEETRISTTCTSFIIMIENLKLGRLMIYNYITGINPYIITNVREFELVDNR